MVLQVNVPKTEILQRFQKLGPFEALPCAESQAVDQGIKIPKYIKGFESSNWYFLTLKTCIN